MKTLPYSALASLFSLLALAAQPALALSPTVKSPQIENPMRVLFVGNSYFYYGDSVHNHVRRMADAAAPGTLDKLQYKSATIGGANLAHHNIEYLTEPGRIGVKEPFELVILADGSAQPLTADRRAASLAKIQEFSEVIRKRGGQVALYMTQSYVPPHKEAKPENARLTEAHYVQSGNKVNALVIPVGLAFEEAYKRRPEMKLHKDYDGSHPELAGTYLAACVVYATVYAKPCSGNSYDYYGKIKKEDAAFLQRVADDTVKAFFSR